MSNWAIALVRYENSRNFYGTASSELQEIVKVVADRIYNRSEDAERVISRWITNHKLPSVPEPTREKMENGRYQFYRWEAVPICDDGIPGYIQDGKNGSFRSIERPNINKKGYPNQFKTILKPWPNGKVEWFDQATWVKSQIDEGSEQVIDPKESNKDVGDQIKPKPYYGDVIYHVDCEYMAKALIASIREGTIIGYKNSPAGMEHIGEVIKIQIIQAANKDRNFIEWRVIRLDDEAEPVMNGENTIIESVWPTMITRILY